MKTKLLGLVAGVVLLGSAVAANASPYVVTLEEVGSNVVATGSGNIDLSGLTTTVATTGFGSVIYPAVGAIVTGALAGQDYYSGSISGPSAFFGSGSESFATGGSGDDVGIEAAASFVFLPSLYVSDTLLSDSATYDTATFASLGVTPGTYKWTWGTGADQSFTLEIGTTPLPAALPLFATGLGALGLLGWRRKRKAAAPVAA
jgi:hypothetical protein